MPWSSYASSAVMPTREEKATGKVGLDTSYRSRICKIFPTFPTETGGSKDLMFHPNPGPWGMVISLVNIHGVPRVFVATSPLSGCLCKYSIPANLCRSYCTSSTKSTNTCAAQLCCSTLQLLIFCCVCRHVNLF